MDLGKQLSHSKGGHVFIKHNNSPSERKVEGYKDEWACVCSVDNQQTNARNMHAQHSCNVGLFNFGCCCLWRVIQLVLQEHSVSFASRPRVLGQKCHRWSKWNRIIYHDSMYVYNGTCPLRLWYAFSQPGSCRHTCMIIARWKRKKEYKTKLIIRCWIQGYLFFFLLKSLNRVHRQLSLSLSLCHSLWLLGWSWVELSWVTNLRGRIVHPAWTGRKHLLSIIFSPATRNRGEVQNGLPVHLVFLLLHAFFIVIFVSSWAK